MGRKKQQQKNQKKNSNQKQNQNSQPKPKNVEQKSRKAVSQTPPAMKLDSRQFSKEAHTALTEIATKEDDPCYLQKDYHPRASGLVQGITAYISTWGLHRLSGDAKKFLAGKAEDTKYKGKVYRKFLQNLKKLSQNDFDIENEGDLIHLPLREYTSLNRLAIQLAKEWSFWAPAVLGEGET